MVTNALPRGKSCVANKPRLLQQMKTLRVNTLKEKPRLRRTDLTQAKSNYFSVLVDNMKTAKWIKERQMLNNSGVVTDSKDYTLTQIWTP